MVLYIANSLAYFSSLDRSIFIKSAYGLALVGYLDQNMPYT